jgi:hypothetical protein
MSLIWASLVKLGSVPNNNACIKKDAMTYISGCQKKKEENSFKKPLGSIKANQIGTLGGRILVVWLIGFCIHA